ncbi:MAG: type II toxin-antitoxin system RelE/ParE family toxin [Xenococcaceae cyanobacterium MO_188.B32]|nr:type II toxin-antitoxin system RelE/ParE family toxin [Xenococcaceae cyanobacterium MO_188.B32]
MEYSVEFKPKAVKNLEKMTATVQKRIFKKIKWLAQNFEHIPPQSLTAELSGLCKLRTGDYRVIYSFSESKKIITIHQIGHRRDIYR